MPNITIPILTIIREPNLSISQPCSGPRIPLSALESANAPDNIDQIDHVLTQKKSQPTILLSVHSFTPILGKKKRSFDLGILFDRYGDLAQKFGQLLSQTGYRVRYNEPYSGYDGLIFSACRHGEHNHLVYLEIEMNNGLLLNPAGIAEMGQKLSQVLQDLFTSQKEHTA